MPSPSYPFDVVLQQLETELPFSLDETRQISSLRERNLPPLIRLDALALVLGISPKLLTAVAHVKDSRYYREFEVEKKDGKKRKIATPRVFLKVIQRWLLANVLYSQEFERDINGFVPTRGIFSNAAMHVGNPHFAKVDIQNFFPSISVTQVEHVFKQFAFPATVSRSLARICTLRGKLPQGAPTSPYLANLVFAPADSSIREWARSQKVVYSRYADDMIFSSVDPISAIFIKKVEEIINANGFSLNKKKSLVLGPGASHIATGLVTNQKVQLPREKRRLIRAIFHRARYNPSSFKKAVPKLQGYAALVNIYNPSLAAQYFEIAKTIENLRVPKRD